MREEAIPVRCLLCRDEYAVREDDMCDICHHLIRGELKRLDDEIKVYLTSWAGFREWEASHA